jgi:hypothetical protein
MAAFEIEMKFFYTEKNIPTHTDEPKNVPKRFQHVATLRVKKN